MLQRWYITHHFPDFPGPPGLRRIPRTSSRHRCSRGPGDRWGSEKTMVNRLVMWNILVNCYSFFKASKILVTLVGFPLNTSIPVDRLKKIHDSTIQHHPTIQAMIIIHVSSTEPPEVWGWQVVQPTSAGLPGYLDIPRSDSSDSLNSYDSRPGKRSHRKRTGKIHHAFLMGIHQLFQWPWLQVRKLSTFTRPGSIWSMQDRRWTVEALTLSVESV